MIGWAALALGSGCSSLFTDGPSDLTSSKLALVEAASAPGNQSAEPGRKVLLVTLSTNRDLGAMILDLGVEPEVRVRTCSPDAPSLPISAAGPYYEGLRLTGHMSAAERSEYTSLTAKLPLGQPYQYQVWFDERVGGSSGGWFGASTPGYDLMDDPQDICIGIEGSPAMGLGVGLATNDAVISKASIAAALGAASP
jgi:hypothetical protein